MVYFTLLRRKAEAEYDIALRLHRKRRDASMEPTHLTHVK